MSDSASQVDSSPGSFRAGAYTQNGSPQPVYIQPRGALAGFIADAILSERGTDVLRITEQPVERSAAITDHAFLEPVRLELDFGYSDSGNGLGYSAAVYAAILNLQALRQPFSVTTGKRLYQSMLIAAISMDTTEHTENALHLRLALREVILVDTQAAAIPPASQQANPAQTDGVTNTGDKQLAPVNNDTIAKTAFNPNGQGYMQATGSIPQ